MKPAGPIKAELSYDHTAEVYYPGMALVLRGPMDVQRQNGSFVSEPVNRWPVVRAKGTKLRFTREEEHY